jgi:hypothetical protein
MNRDERRTRARGLPPTPTLVRNVRALMPTDPEAGGTWVSVNQHGMSMALLNRYEESPQDPGGTFTSRGLLIRELGWMERPEEVEGELRSRPLQRFRPFTLAGLARGGMPHLFDWDGHQLTRSVVADPGLVRASSGSHQLEAEGARGALFRTASGEPGGLTAATLERLHRSHQPVRGPVSICMHREEAMTVSLSLITVIKKKISIFYVDGPPGETAGGLPQSL